MAYDFCSTFQEAASAATKPVRHHAVHHAVGRIRHHAHHIQFGHAVPSATPADACMKQAGFGSHPGVSPASSAGRAMAAHPVSGAALPKAALASLAVSGAAALLATAALAMTDLPAVAFSPSPSADETAWSQDSALSDLGGGEAGWAVGGPAASSPHATASLPSTQPAITSAARLPLTPAPTPALARPDVVSVPEPSSLALLLLALVPIWALRTMAVSGAAPAFASTRARSGR